jgi:hypothetical protein
MTISPKRGEMKELESDWENSDDMRAERMEKRVQELGRGNPRNQKEGKEENKIVNGVAVW